MEPLKLFWPHPRVEFNGRGISEYWAEAMEKLGFSITQDYASADMVFFISDSQLDRRYIGEKPTVAFFWGWLPERCLLPDFFDFAKPKLDMLGACTRVLVPGPITQYQLANFGLQSEVCLPGVDSVTLERFQGNAVPQQRVVFVSRLAQHKQLELLISAMAALEPKVPLLVLGPGEGDILEGYRSVAQRNGVPTTFLEPTDAEKVRLIQDSMALVMPSRFEGLSLAPLEALYLGTPVIASDIPQHRWLLQEDVEYFSSVDGLAGTLIDVLNNQPKARQKAQKARERIRNAFSIEAAAGRLWAHLHQAHKEFLGQRVREHPDDLDLMRLCYNMEARRNWAYGLTEIPGYSAPARFDPTWARHFRAQFFIRELRKAGAQEILDLGCGPVYPTIFAKAGFQVIGVDIAEETVAQARAIAEKWGVADLVNVQQGYAQHLPFPDDHFSGVILGEILEHVHDPGVVLREAMRVVKPGGRLIASSPIEGHHWDPMHIASPSGGWNDELIDKLLVPWTSNVVSIEKIAEQGTEPSCYLLVLQK